MTMGERLISKDAIMNRTITYIGNDAYIALWRIEDEPEIEAEPVKHGKWVRDPDAIDWDIGGWRCSVCEGVNYAIPLNAMPFMWSCSRYCPNCGAKMDRKGD